MGGMASLGISISGLNAAQAGLYVTGHNISNVDTAGYVRQQVLQSDFLSFNVGINPNGVMQVGLGTNIEVIRQIRDKFLDISYRRESSKGGFYDVKTETGLEIESILGELQSDYETANVITDMWEALHELSQFPSGLDTRGNFISTCIAFINKANNVGDRLFEYQHNLDLQIRQSVTRVNHLVQQIHELNSKIVIAESSGDRANDYRDSRNLAMDELSSLMEVTFKEKTNGRIDIITVEGNELLVNGSINRLGLKYTAEGYSFVEPVFTQKMDILPPDADPITFTTLYNLTGEIGPEWANDKGKIKSLMVCRGYHPANYATTPGEMPVATAYPGGRLDPGYARDLLAYEKEAFNMSQAFIPKVQREFDNLIHAIVTLINDAVAPDQVDPDDPDAPAVPVGLDGSSYTEIFVRKFMPRYDPDSGERIPEDPKDPYSLYSLSNIEINPLLLDAGGYNSIALSLTGDIDDNSLVQEILAKWNSNFITYDGGVPLNVNDTYKHFVNNVGIETQEAINYSNGLRELMVQIQNKRLAMSGVSLDEEMTNMLKYQHAYNANARMINIVDSMIDKLVNATGRVGR